MKSHGNLFARICDPVALQAALARASRGKKTRGPVAAFLNNAPAELETLREELLAGTYTPRPYRQFRILDPKPRLISCADFRDRVVHHALCAAIGPCIDRRLISDNFACRVGGGSHRAILRARDFSRRFSFCLKTDIRQYYESVNHDILLGKVTRLFRECRLVELVDRIVRSPVPGQTKGCGLPIGNLTSQWLANLYLDEIDHWVKEVRRVPGYVRYMDDLAFWSDSRQVLWDVAVELNTRLGQRLALELKARATVLAPTREGMPFLGWRVYPGMLRVRGSRLRRSRRLLRRREEQCAAGKLSEAQLQACARSMHGLRQFFGTGPALVRDNHQFGTVEQRLKPGQPGWELEERRSVELPGGEPQQERPRQPQRQPGFSSREHSQILCLDPEGHKEGKDKRLSHPPHPVSRLAGTKPQITPPPVIPSFGDHRGGADPDLNRKESPCH